MSISKKLKLILPRIPKCGSTSTTTWLTKLDPSLLEENTGDHNNVYHYISELERDGISLSGYELVMVGRNPFKRQVSSFEYSKMLDPSNFDMTFEEFYKTLELKHICHYSNGVYKKNYGDNEEWHTDSCFMNQHHYFIINGHPDFPLERMQLVQLENFESDMEKIGFKGAELPHMNKHDDRELTDGETVPANTASTYQGSNYEIKDWTEYYGNSEIVHKIQELYKYDFKLFGYDPNINPYTEEPWNL
tara:strand:+ start:50 stop:790 length:741 start_codon:yes stop_codon:yes gene_type:complete